MRKWIFAVLLLTAACTPKSGIRTIRTTENTEADLGVIQEKDGPVTVRLVVRNELADTLHPVQVYTPCGCTAAETDRRSIAPGADEIIEVTYNPAYRPGIFMEEIQVYYADSPVRMRSLLIKGEVIGYNHPIEEDRPYAFGQGLYLSHEVLHYGKLAPGQTDDMFIRHGNGNKKAADIRFDIPPEYASSIGLRQPGVMEADGRDTLHVRFTMPEGPAPGDTLLIPLQPLVNGKKTDKILYIKAIAP